MHYTVKVPSSGICLVIKGFFSSRLVSTSQARPVLVIMSTCSFLKFTLAPTSGYWGFLGRIHKQLCSLWRTVYLGVAINSCAIAGEKTSLVWKRLDWHNIYLREPYLKHIYSIYNLYILYANRTSLPLSSSFLFLFGHPIISILVIGGLYLAPAFFFFIWKLGCPLPCTLMTMVFQWPFLCR